MHTNQLKKLCKDLSAKVNDLTFQPPVSYVYNPLDYARDAVEKYLDLACQGHPEVMFLGMNPGPWGMAQTGVPFGTVPMVRDWLGITSRVDRPRNEHPKRPVLGFDTTREEVSGTRFWSWAKTNFGTPAAFFERFFVANYCPLVFMEESGRNRTPDKLPVTERKALYQACDEALEKLVDILEPSWIVGIGKFAEDRARVVLGHRDISIGRVLHPSPASPIANRGWAEQAHQQLKELGLV